MIVFQTQDNFNDFSSFAIKYTIFQSAKTRTTHLSYQDNVEPNTGKYHSHDGTQLYSSLDDLFKDYKFGCIFWCPPQDWTLSQDWLQHNFDIFSIATIVKQLILSISCHMVNV